MLSFTLGLGKRCVHKFFVINKNVIIRLYKGNENLLFCTSNGVCLPYRVENVGKHYIHNIVNCSSKHILRFIDCVYHNVVYKHV